MIMSDVIDEAKCIDDEEEEDWRIFDMTTEQRKSMGLLVVTHEEMRNAIKVSYIREYSKPDEDDWPPIILELSTRLGVTPKVVKNVFVACRGGKKKPRKAK
jgi:hypothetical protein